MQPVSTFWSITPIQHLPVFLDGTITDASIFYAVGLWIEDENEAKQIFGPIALWNTSSVTTMNDCTAARTAC
jgi:hypothetical protein